MLCFGEDCLGVAEDTDTLLEAKGDGFYQTFEGSAYCGFGGMAGFWGLLLPVGAEENGIFIGNYSDLNFKECRLSEAFSPKTGQWLGAVESKSGAHMPLFFVTAGNYWFM